ncbi:VIT family-domain-containing protein [Annulohypoxylon moriforme]|nr:VIT family-domain-containing protein [Annulohypoxylon moriforme]
MQGGKIRAFFARLGLQDEQAQESPSTYSAIASSPRTPIDTSIISRRVSEDSSFNGYRPDSQRGATNSRLSQFLSHFTLGFADGLTVPFALTAGLSSLGQTKTVIYAGAAEICAGCISMGIGGYLAARGEGTSDMDGYDQNEKLETADQDSVQSYLALLDLPPDLLQSVRAHVNHNPAVIRRLLCHTNSAVDGLTGKAKEFPPAIVGLSISFGYMLGGLLPLFPYFFVGSVEDGLQWSFVVCILALFIFGFTKDFLLHPESTEGRWQHENARRGPDKWKRVKHGSWEGIRMVIMGGIAAVAAVLCVRLFEGVIS